MKCNVTCFSSSAPVPRTKWKKKHKGQLRVQTRNCRVRKVNSLNQPFIWSNTLKQKIIALSEQDSENRDRQYREKLLKARPRFPGEENNCRSWNSWNWKNAISFKGWSFESRPDASGLICHRTQNVPAVKPNMRRLVTHRKSLRTRSRYNSSKKKL